MAQVSGPYFGLHHLVMLVGLECSSFQRRELASDKARVRIVGGFPQPWQGGLEKNLDPHQEQPLPH